MSDRLRGVSFAVIASVLTSIAQLAFKFASRHAGPWVSIAWNGYVWIGIVSYLMAFVLMMKAYRLGELSVLFPLTSLCYVWNLFAGHLILGETLGMARVSGTLLIIGGAAVLAKA